MKTRLSAHTSTSAYEAEQRKDDLWQSVDLDPGVNPEPEGKLGVETEVRGHS